MVIRHLSLFVLALMATSAVGQTVTGSGTSNVLPVFTGTSTVGNSPISVSGGNVGIGTTTPQAPLHLLGPATSEFSGTQNAFTGGNLVLDGNTSGRIVGQGASLTFAFPADTDGGNHFEQARILATPDNSANVDGSGRLYLQVRSFYTPLGISSGWNWRTGLMIQSNGNVGIGSTAPSVALEVNGSLKLDAGSSLSSGGGSITFPDATIQATAWNGVLSGGDYAESVDVTGDRKAYEPGDVLVVDPTSEGRFLKSSKPYSTAVAGVYSTRPGAVGRRQVSDRSHMTEEVPMAMVGIIPTKVCAEGGSIRPGDLLVTSSTPGCAMKGTERTQMLGAVIGKALGHLESGAGVIEVVVTLQ